MRPVVNVYRLGRLPYVKALSIQQLLFASLKDNLKSTNTTPMSAMPIKANYNKGAKDFIIPTSSASCSLASSPSQFPSYPDHQCRFSDPIHAVSTQNSLLIVEHDPVYTIGIRTKQYDDNYVSRLRERLVENGVHADFVKTQRGGLITFHGPGQLVAYPILYLGDFSRTIRNKSVREYVKLLEKTIIEALDQIGIRDAQTLDGYPGVWVAGGDRKIGFVGITCKQYVTMHGVAINCDCDLSWFDHIVSCGIEDKIITSVQRELIWARNSNHQLDQNTKATNKRDNSGESASQLHDLDSLLSSRSQSLVTRFNYNGIAKCFESQLPSGNLAQLSESFCTSFSRNFDCTLKNDVLHFRIN